MSWFFIALSAHVLWSTVNVGDKYLIARFREHSASAVTLLMFMAMCALISGTIFTATHIPIIKTLTYVQLVGVFLSGVVHTIAVWLYIRALEIDEASSVASWFLMLPIFAFIFAFLFLGETTTMTQFFGILVIIAGAVLFSLKYHHTEKKHSIPWKMIGFMVLSCLLFTFSDIFFKTHVASVSIFWGVIGISQLGVGFIGLLLLCIPVCRKEFIRMLFGQGTKLFSINIAGEVATLAGNAIKFLAILHAPIALVASLEGYQPLIVYLLTIPLSYIAPKYFIFERTRWHIALKIMGAICLIIGTYLLL